MTQDIYMGRKLVDGRAAEALEDVFGLAAELSGKIDPLEAKAWVINVGGDPSGDRSPPISCSDSAP
jgi:hypothetical protein